jgi:hypothetical protein
MCLNRVVNARCECAKNVAHFREQTFVLGKSTSRREICIRDTWLLLPPIRV